MILNLNKKLDMINKVEISCPHLDGHSSETQISWGLVVKTHMETGSHYIQLIK
jgi:hypothetical protein